MSLTKDDLKAIKDIVEDAKEDIKIDVAAGFAEVHEKFTEVHEKFNEVHEKIDTAVADLSVKIQHVDDKVTVKDLKLENTVERVDKLEIQLKKFKTRTA